MKLNIQEVVMDYLRNHDGNLYAEDNNMTLRMGSLDVDVESIWYSDKEDKIYLHVGCKEFEGDLDIESLSDENQEKMLKAFGATIPYKFDEQAFLDRYCPKDGGNDYLGWIDDICKLLDGDAKPGDSASTGEYANLSEADLRKELKRLTAIVLHQAVDRYVEEEY